VGGARSWRAFVGFVGHSGSGGVWQCGRPGTFARRLARGCNALVWRVGVTRWCDALVWRVGMARWCGALVRGAVVGRSRGERLWRVGVACWRAREFDPRGGWSRGV